MEVLKTHEHIPHRLSNRCYGSHRTRDRERAIDTRIEGAGFGAQSAHALGAASQPRGGDRGGGLRDFASVRAALEGVGRAYFVFPNVPGIIQATAYFAQAATEVGLEAIVNMSQISARRDAKSNAARDHWIAERVFDRSGVAVTHLRPTFFAEWLLYFARMVVREGP